MANDHYAVLVTINHYPGLSDLEGPENDGHAFEKWLCDPNGGDMDSARVRHICSSNYAPPATDPDDANPTEQELKRALNGWLRNGDAWREKVGGRLYLYFAGHGFTGGSSNNDPALFTAGARQGDTAHIAGYRYASKIVNAGFFDEVLLIMDCCQDVMKGSQVIEPTWAPPDRNSSANVKFLQVYGAPRGRKAFEDDFLGDVRGLFSTVLVEALAIADTDAQGWVSGYTLKNKLLQLWKERFRDRTQYDPPVHLPAGADIQLYQRAVPPPPPPPPEASPDANFRERIVRSTRDALQRSSATLVAADAGLDIVVVDDKFAQVGAGTGTLTIALPDGSYTALAQAPGATSEITFEMLGKELRIALPMPVFKSPAPFKEIERGQDSYLRAAVQAASSLPYGPRDVHQAELFIVVRSPYLLDWPDALTRLRIVGLNDDAEIELINNFRILHGSNAGTFYIKAFVTPASYALIFTDDDESGVLLPAYDGWRTELYVDCPDDREPWTPDLAGAAMFLTPSNQPSPLGNSSARATELARLRLMNGWAVSPPTEEQAARAPLIALFAAYSAATATPPEQERVKVCLDMLPPALRETMADAVLLDRWCQLANKQEPASLGWPPLLPVLSAGWQLMTRMPKANDDNSLAMEAIGQWRLAGSMWAYWRQPLEKAALLRQRLRGAGLVNELDGDAGPPAAVTINPPWGLEVWRKVRNGMSTPVPGHSPFQQALRRRILDCLAENETDNPVLALAATFGLTLTLAIQAYNAVYAQAHEATLGQREVDA